MSELKYKRILLKISGEGLCTPGEFGINVEVLNGIAQELKDIHDMGVQIGLVVGGGNMIRGSVLSQLGVNRSNADYMGMLATVINGLALKDTLDRMGIKTRVLSAIDIHSVAEPFIRGRAIRHLEKGRLVIFVSGTGNTHFTTDTGAAQRALDINAEILMKATKVDGIYDSDPMINPDAKRYETLSYLDVLNQGLKVMDSTAASLCMENKMPMMVFDLKKHGNLKRAVQGETIGTFIKGE